ncbi:coiled-coil domain-containing protein 42 [Latimeria chalumnae]|uniref:coiled-coil domain-containing protein 42 n=1 Tax=Latimeria chalumnae TaxID=7897 RepID=UPI0006D928F5|nr:PREDICTED: coiled-coil domain-containing protein 42A [Latimeria chalumnae]|eukprot:XP_014346854.1 PREDICTED: coiled-coil domain-containing protein 42A [Latimeria chalumnae]
MGESLAEYFKTLYGHKLVNLLVKLSDGSEEQLAPSTRLLEKKKEAAVVHEAMEAQREAFHLKMEGLKHRRADLNQKEQHLKEYLLKFDQFLKENDLKKLRAVKKANKEREVKRQKDRDLANLQDETLALNLVKQKLLKKLQKYSLYVNYLEKVIEASDEFEEVHQVMSRYDTLVMTQEDLLQTAQESQETIDRAKARLLHYVEEKNDEILQYNNRLAQLQTRLDKAQSEAVVWESRWAYIQNTAAKKTLLLGTIKMATLNLFQTVSKHAKAKMTVPLEDTQQQLEVIQQFIQELTSIWMDVNKFEQSATAS